MPHKLPCSPSSSDSASDSTSNPVPQTFNPHAVHRFTDCSIDLKTRTEHPVNSSFPYRFGPTIGNYDTPRAQTSSSPPSSDCYYPVAPPSTTTSSSSSSSTSKLPASPRKTGIFVPFRQETASPDIPDILKQDSSKAYSFQDSTRGTPNRSGVSSPPVNGRRQ